MTGLLRAFTVVGALIATWALLYWALWHLVIRDQDPGDDPTR